MAFQKQQARILNGGLSLVPPVDLTPAPDSLHLQNWRIDQAGQLRSRRGLLRDGSPGSVHSLFRTGTDRFGGVGSTLRYGTALDSTLASGFDGQPLSFAAQSEHVWCMNPARQVKVKDRVAQNWGVAAPTSAPVATAGASASVLLAEFQSEEAWEVSYFAANVATLNPTFEDVLTEQGTVTATESSADLVGVGTNWTPAMVGANIQVIVSDDWSVYSVVAAVPDETHLTLITPFDAGTRSGYAYSITQTRAAVDYDLSNKQSGAASLHIACNPPGRWQARRSGAWDTRIQGDAEDDDQFRLWVYASDPAAVSTIKVTLRTETAAAEVTIPGARLQQQVFTWTQLHVARRANLDSLLGASPAWTALLQQIAAARESGDAVTLEALEQQRYVLGAELQTATPAFQTIGEFDWGAVTGLWVEADVTSACDVHFDRAEFVGGLQSSLEGEFTFFVTFANAEGHESNASPGAEAVELRKQAVALSNIPVSPDPQVTARHIYGIGGGVLSPMRFATVAGNAATTATLTVSVPQVQTLGIRMPMDHDPPPAARGVCGPHLGRLFAWRGNRLYWSKVAQPWAWPGADDEAEGSWVDVGEAGEDIVACTYRGRTLTIYKQRSVHRLSGDPATIGNDPERTGAGIGLVGPKAITSEGEVDYLVGAQGVYRYNGDREEELSRKVAPLFRGERVRVGYDVTLQPVELTAMAACVLAVRFGRLYLSYPEAGHTTPTATLVLNLDTGDWMQYRSSLGGFTALYGEGQGNAFLGAAGSGIYELEEGATDDGQAIPLVWQSGFVDQGVPDNDKAYADLVVEAVTADPGEAPSSLVVKVGYASGTKAWQTLGTIQATERKAFPFPLGVNGIGPEERNLAVRIEGDARSGVTIFAAYVHWYPIARKALTFDSGVISLAGELAGFEADGTITDTLSWSIYTDFPGGFIEQRATGQVAATGQRVHGVTLDAPLRGTRGRVVVWSAQPFQLHRIRLKERAAGVLLDTNERWDSAALPVGGN